MGLSFVAIDFETANSFRGSPCAIGLVKVVDGNIHSEYSTLVKPPHGFDNFDGFNVSIHGITAQLVKDKPRFGDLWPEIQKFIGSLPLVAHNAGFDMGVLREALRVSDISWPSIYYACTMVMSRKMYSITSHSLPFVVEASGLSWDEELHHEAQYDALMAAGIAIAMARLNQCDSLDELLNGLKISIGRLEPDGWEGCRSKHASARSPFNREINVKDIVVNSDADQSHHLYGKRVVFTGELSSMTRAEAWKMVGSLGGFPQRGITRETNFLVMGDQDLGVLRLGETRSAKFREAKKRKVEGQNIEVMSEADFLTYLEPESGSFR